MIVRIQKILDEFLYSWRASIDWNTIFATMLFPISCPLNGGFNFRSFAESQKNMFKKYCVFQDIKLFLYNVVCGRFQWFGFMLFEYF